MTAGRDGPPLDLERIIITLQRHGVEFLLVGGAGAQAHGAQRPTEDVDCLPRATVENYERLAAALRELGARLRVHGMSDAEARQLPMQIDATALANLRASTWMTDAGPLDLLFEMADRAGRTRGYGDLVDRSVIATAGELAVRVAALADIVASKEFADRDKDREALPELHRLLDRQRSGDASPEQGR